MLNCARIVQTWASARSLSCDKRPSSAGADHKNKPSLASEVGSASSSSAPKRKTTESEDSAALVQVTGEERKTVDNCFSRTKSTKQGEMKKIYDFRALRLCDLTGEPSNPEDYAVAFRLPHNLVNAIV